MKKVMVPKYWLALPVILVIYAAAKGGSQTPTMLILRLVLLAVGYVASLFDILEKRVPNRLAAALAGAWLLILAPDHNTIARFRSRYRVWGGGIFVFIGREEGGYRYEAEIFPNGIF